MTYSDLQSRILDWLDRSDLTSVVTDFISDAEARLNRDVRVRQLSARTDVDITADGHDLPTDLRVVDSWYHDGSTYFGPLEMVDAGKLPELKAVYGQTGVPMFFSVVDGEGLTAYFAPEPDDTYSTKLTYYRRVPALSDVATTNWFLDSHPDIYRLAAMSEAALYLKDSELYAGVEAQLGPRLEDLDRSANAEQYAGSLVRRPRMARNAPARGPGFGASLAAPSPPSACSSTGW